VFARKKAPSAAAADDDDDAAADDDDDVMDRVRNLTVTSPASNMGFFLLCMMHSHAIDQQDQLTRSSNTSIF
jgi:hypothetical protein